VSATNQTALWVLRAQCGDREALERLLRHVYSLLGRYLRSVVGERDADDVLQEVLVVIYRKLASLRDPELLRPWAFRIASRAAFRHAATNEVGRLTRGHRDVRRVCVARLRGATRRQRQDVSVRCCARRDLRHRLEYLRVGDSHDSNDEANPSRD
jgi:hypothetical protein